MNIDFLGALSLAGMVFCGLTIILAGGSQFPWISPLTLILAILTIGFAWMFFVVESRVEEPILSLRFFRKRGFAFGNGVIFMASFAIFCLFAYLPLFIQGALRKTPLEVSTIMLAISVAWSATPIILTRFLHLITNKIATCVGAALLVIGSAYALTFSASTTMTQCLIAFTLAGIGMGSMTLCTLLVVQASLTAKDLGVATSSHQFSRTLGGTIGVGIAGAVATGSLVFRLNKTGDTLPPEVLRVVSENMESILKPEFFTPLSESAKLILQNALAGSISSVFWVVFGTGLLALLFSVLLPKESRKTDD